MDGPHARPPGSGRRRVQLSQRFGSRTWLAASGSTAGQPNCTAELRSSNATRRSCLENRPNPRKQESAEHGRAEQARSEAQANLVEAQRQQRRAEASFRQARAAVDDSLTRISENNLLNVPGLRPLRRELIEAALKYYMGFVKQRGDEPELQKDLAAAYTRVGRITSDLGSKADALKSYRQAIGIQTELVRLASDRERPGRAGRAGPVPSGGRPPGARANGEGNQAETSFAQAETLWQQAAHQEPGNPEVQNGLADCLNDASARKNRPGNWSGPPNCTAKRCSSSASSSGITRSIRRSPGSDTSWPGNTSGWVTSGSG